MQFDAAQLERLEHERNIWLATARADGRAHLVPVWFVYWQAAVYICVEPHSVKARNLARDPRTTLALEDGDRALVLAGKAAPVTAPPEVAARFKAKYNWELGSDAQYTSVLCITLLQRVMG
ncbi:hypothetical protein LBMAG37_20600 [Anaerolineae bacterium]|nr:hypothetical protein LBMAG37_20600 [Anaerolineae bacterium]